MSEHRTSRVVATTLVVLASFLVFFTTITVWAHRTLLNTDIYVETVAPLASDPAIQAATADQVTAQVMGLMESQQVLQRALPERITFLAQPLDTAIERFVRDTSLRILQSEQFATLWTTVNRKAHEKAVAVLRGETDRVLVDQGNVSLNLLPVVSRVLNRVSETAPGLLDGRTVPVIAPETDPEVARQQLSTALGRELKPDAGVVELYRSDRLAAAQTMVHRFDQLVWVLLGLTVLCIVVAIALPGNRRRTVGRLGLGIALVMALAIGGARGGRNYILDQIANDANRAAVDRVLTISLDSLALAGRILLVIGAVVFLVCALFGDRPWARAVRNSTVSGAGRVGRAARGAAEPFSVAASPFVARYRSELLLFGVAAGVVWLIVADVTLWSLLVVLALVALWVLGVVALAGREPPEGADLAAS